MRRRSRSCSVARPPSSSIDSTNCSTKGVEAGRLRFTTDAVAAVADRDVVFLCVQTPQGDDGSADMRHVHAALAELEPHLKSGAVVVNKSTVPVGSARSMTSDAHPRRHPHRQQPRVPPRGHGHRRLPVARPSRRRLRRPRRGRAGRRALRPARRHDPHHRPRDQRDHQVRGQRLPRHQAQLRQRHRHTVRAGRRRHARRRQGHGLRPTHRSRVPEARPGLGWQLLPEGLPSARAHRRRGRATRSTCSAASSSATSSSSTAPPTRCAAAAGGSLQGVTVAVWGLTFKAGTDDLRDSPVAGHRRAAARPEAPSSRAVRPHRRRSPPRPARRHRAVRHQHRGLPRRRRPRRPHRVGHLHQGRSRPMSPR